jgi:hypothetical protein
MMRSARCASAALLVAFLPACTSYYYLPAPSVSLAGAHQPIQKSRITLRNGEAFTLSGARISGDSLRGFVGGGRGKSVALADVTSAGIRQVNPAKTVGLVLGVAAVAASASLFVLTISAMDEVISECWGTC